MAYVLILVVIACILFVSLVCDRNRDLDAD